jgi:hypothetical protein
MHCSSLFLSATFPFLFELRGESCFTLVSPTATFTFILLVFPAELCED